MKKFEAHVEVTYHHMETPRVVLDGRDITHLLMPGGIDITFPEEPDEPPLAVLTFAADVDLNLDAIVESA